MEKRSNSVSTSGGSSRVLERIALVVALCSLTAVAAGTFVSCGDADLLIPGSGPVIPSVIPSDGTPDDPNNTPTP